MTSAILAALLLQSASAPPPVSLIPAGTPFDSIDWEQDPIATYRHCGLDYEFLEVDCGVVTQTGQELIIFDHMVTRASFPADAPWVHDTPFGRLIAGQDFRASFAILTQFCADHDLITDGSDLTLTAWACGTSQDDDVLSITFDASYSAATIASSVPSP